MTTDRRQCRSKRYELSENSGNAARLFIQGNDEGSVEISNNPQDFNPVTQETTKGAQAIDRAAEELTNLTSRLQSKAGAFQVD